MRSTQSGLVAPGPYLRRGNESGRYRSSCTSAGPRRISPAWRLQARRRSLFADLLSGTGHGMRAKTHPQLQLTVSAAQGPRAAYDSLLPQKLLFRRLPVLVQQKLPSSVSLRKRKKVFSPYFELAGTDPPKLQPKVASHSAPPRGCEHWYLRHPPTSARMTRNVHCQRRSL